MRINYLGEASLQSVNTLTLVAFVRDESFLELNIPVFGVGSCKCVPLVSILQLLRAEREKKELNRNQSFLFFFLFFLST